RARGTGLGECAAAVRGRRANGGARAGVRPGVDGAPRPRPAHRCPRTSGRDVRLLRRSRLRRGKRRDGSAARSGARPRRGSRLVDAAPVTRRWCRKGNVTDRSADGPDAVDTLPPPVLIAVDEASGIGVLTLDRPKQRNPLSVETMREVIAGLTALAADSKVIVVRAEGPVFSAGHD